MSYVFHPFKRYKVTTTPLRLLMRSLDIVFVLTIQSEMKKKNQRRFLLSFAICTLANMSPR